MRFYWRSNNGRNAIAWTGVRNGAHYYCTSIAQVRARGGADGKDGRGATSRNKPQ